MKRTDLYKEFLLLFGPLNSPRFSYFRCYGIDKGAVSNMQIYVAVVTKASSKPRSLNLRHVDLG